MIPSWKKPIPLTGQDVEQRRGAMLYTSYRLAVNEWARDPIAKWLLERELLKVLNEIVQGRHLPLDWSEGSPDFRFPPSAGRIRDNRG